MQYRGFRFDGKVLDRIDGYEDAVFLSDDAVACREVAVALGVPASQVTAFHAESPPVSQQTIPPAPALTPDPDVAALTTIIAKADTDITVAEVKTAVLRFLRRRARQGTL